MATNYPTAADAPLPPAGIPYDTTFQQRIDGQIQAIGGAVVSQLNSPTSLQYWVADPGQPGIAKGCAVALRGAAGVGGAPLLVLATATNLAAGAVYVGVAMTTIAPGIGGPVAVSGFVSASVSGLVASANAFVRANTATAVLERVAAFTGSDLRVGVANSAGGMVVQVVPPVAASGTVTFAHGLDSARPVASTALIGRQYYGDDSGILYECVAAATGSATGWTVVNIGSDTATMGPFADANYITSLPVAGGPNGTSPFTFAIQFVASTLPGVTGKCFWSHTNATMTSGWGIFASATAANTMALKLSIAGVPAVVELPGAAIGATGIPYCLAVAIDAGSPHPVRYAFNGILQTATTVAGVYTAPVATDVNMIGRFAGAGLPCDFASIAWAQAFNTGLVNADLQALSSNVNNWSPGAVTAEPVSNWQARWYAAGAQAFMPIPGGLLALPDQSIYMTTAGNFQKVARAVYAP